MPKHYQILKTVPFSPTITFLFYPLIALTSIVSISYFTLSTLILLIALFLASSFFTIIIQPRPIKLSLLNIFLFGVLTSGLIFLGYLWSLKELSIWSVGGSISTVLLLIVISRNQYHKKSVQGVGVGRMKLQ